jgi:hypothetical protein
VEPRCRKSADEKPTIDRYQDKLAVQAKNFAQQTARDVTGHFIYISEIYRRTANQDTLIFTDTRQPDGFDILLSLLTAPYTTIEVKCW